ncbi:MAG: uncharacterized protein A8A55_2388 [Amphiamblys sp. WSBS2006]|nr:MAG: uncharacterized protein A8A55_2388 [Amphiamblys sp. WSBS2006]
MIVKRGIIPSAEQTSKTELVLFENIFIEKIGEKKMYRINAREELRLFDFADSALSGFVFMKVTLINMSSSDIEECWAVAPGIRRCKWVVLSQCRLTSEVPFSRVTRLRLIGNVGIQSGAFFFRQTQIRTFEAKGDFRSLVMCDKKESFFEEIRLDGEGASDFFIFMRKNNKGLKRIEIEEKDGDLGFSFQENGAFSGLEHCRLGGKNVSDLLSMVGNEGGKTLRTLSITDSAVFIRPVLSAFHCLEQCTLSGNGVWEVFQEVARRNVAQFRKIRVEEKGHCEVLRLFDKKEVELFKGLRSISLSGSGASSVFLQIAPDTIEEVDITEHDEFDTMNALYKRGLLCSLKSCFLGGKKAFGFFLQLGRLVPQKLVSAHVLEKKKVQRIKRGMFYGLKELSLEGSCMLGQLSFLSFKLGHVLEKITIHDRCPSHSADERSLFSGDEREIVKIPFYNVRECSLSGCGVSVAFCGFFRSGEYLKKLSIQETGVFGGEIRESFPVLEECFLEGAGASLFFSELSADAGRIEKLTVSDKDVFSVPSGSLSFLKRCSLSGYGVSTAFALFSSSCSESLEYLSLTEFGVFVKKIPGVFKNLRRAYLWGDGADEDVFSGGVKNCFVIVDQD